MAIDSDVPAVRFPPPLVFLGFLLLGPLLERVLPLPRPGLPWPLGAAVAAAGAVVIAAAQRHFFVAGENPVPWTGSGTMLATGVYRWSRNPMYFGMALVQAGLALVLDNLWSLLLLLPALAAIQHFVIRQEETYLLRRFGAPYRAYQARVRRWL